MKKMILLLSFLFVGLLSFSQIYERIDSLLEEEPYWIYQLDKDGNLTTDSIKGINTLTPLPQIMKIIPIPYEENAVYFDSVIWLGNKASKNTLYHEKIHLILDRLDRFKDLSREEMFLQEFFCYVTIEILTKQFSDTGWEQERYQKAIYSTAINNFGFQAQFYFSHFKSNRSGSFDEFEKHLELMQSTVQVYWTEIGLPYKGVVQVVPENQKKDLFENIVRLFAKE